MCCTPLAAIQPGVIAAASAYADRLRARIYVLYHAHCQDGFGAAYAAWTAFGSDEGVEYIPVTHGEPPPPMKPGSMVYILDFSYPLPVLIDLDAIHTLRVIDHHATAAPALEGQAFATFDQSKSGAVLAWEYFQSLGFVDGVVPELLMYVQDRDLWKWELYMSREVSAALAMHPRTFDAWLALDSHNGVEQLREEGRIALIVQRRLVLSMADRAYDSYIAGYGVPTANAPVLISEVCEELMARNPHATFVATYFDDQGTRRVWSLRCGPEFNVGTLAKSLGGGGHAQSAGFTQAAPHHYSRL